MSTLQAETTSALEVSVAGVGRINIVQILEVEMDELERVTAAGQQALAFFQFTLGALVSAGLSWVGIASPTATQQATYAAVSVALAALSFWFGFQWWRERGQRIAVFSRIRKRIVIAGPLPPP